MWKLTTCVCPLLLFASCTILHLFSLLPSHSSSKMLVSSLYFILCLGLYHSVDVYDGMGVHHEHVFGSQSSIFD